MNEDWANAINEEYGTDFKVAPDEIEEEEEAPEAPEVPEKKEEEEEEAPEAPEKKEEEEADEEEEKPETAEEREAREAKEAEDAAAAAAAKKDNEPEERPATKEEIKNALRELETERTQQAATHTELQKEVLETLFPEGIDRQLRDSEGDPITGIDDLTKLINPKTNDYFTEEEAGAWLLSAQQQLNQDIEKLETYASSIVETNVSLKDGADRVQELYGDLLESMPDVADKVLEAYSKTLVRDPKTGIVIKAPVDVTEFYNIALGPYKQVAAQLTQQKEAEAKAAKKAAEEAALAEREERGDIKLKGSSKLPKSQDEEGWGDAYEQYFNS